MILDVFDIWTTYHLNGLTNYPAHAVKPHAQYQTEISNMRLWFNVAVWYIFFKGKKIITETFFRNNGIFPMLHLLYTGM